MDTVSSGKLSDALALWARDELTPCLSVIFQRERDRVLGALGTELAVHRLRTQRITLEPDSHPALIRRRVLAALARRFIPLLSLAEPEPGSCFLLARLVREVGLDTAHTARRALLVLPDSAQPQVRRFAALTRTCSVELGY